MSSANYYGNKGYDQAVSSDRARHKKEREQSAARVAVETYPGSGVFETGRNYHPEIPPESIKVIK